MKKRIAMLWILMAVAMSAHSVLLFADYLTETPDGLLIILPKDFWMGYDPVQMLFLMALVGWLIPLWMAFLSVTLKGSANRWLNVILGIVFTIHNIWHITLPCCAMVHQRLIVVSTIIASALVVWYAWKMPKEKT